MKTRFLRIATLLLCVVMLAGCGHSGAISAEASASARELMSTPVPKSEVCRFEDMVYERPDADKLSDCVQRLTAALDGDSDLTQVTELLDECFAEYDHLCSMLSIADVRSCQDCTDAYYAAEYDWCCDYYADVQQTMEELYCACAESSYSAQLETDYFWEGFAEEYGGEYDTLLDDESVALMQEETALLSEYRAIISDAVIELDGETVNLDEYLASADEDDYYRATDAYYEQYNPKLAELYIELVGVRKALAQSMGFDSYEQMQYEYNFDRDYTPEQADAYLEDIKTYILPLYNRITAAGYAGAISYDYLSERRLLDIMRSMVEGMGGDVEVAFAFMEDGGLYDTEYRSDKADMSFQTYITDYEAPFLFISPCCDIEDLLTFAHEFGHYTDAYVNLNAYETIDLAECFSQAMEYLALYELEDELDDYELSNLRLIKLIDTLDLYVQQGSFAQFESQVYAMDESELSAESLNALSLELAKEYGYYDGYSSDYYAMSWVDITHFFEQPFYIISYPVSNDIAMQIFELEQSSDGAGLEKYLEMLPRESDMMIESAEAVGLLSPFSEGRVKQISETLQTMFNEL